MCERGGRGGKEGRMRFHFFVWRGCARFFFSRCLFGYFCACTGAFVPLVYVCVCACECVRVCVPACVRACVHACVRISMISRCRNGQSLVRRISGERPRSLMNVKSRFMCACLRICVRGGEEAQVVFTCAYKLACLYAYMYICEHTRAHLLIRGRAHTQTGSIAGEGHR